mmetsp:Transcript_49603/g.144191  ORF Transcript_49603/g.144191 Transcript_49603/m.144191 type:complete len:275 (+) Transcript_49603:761-1585(+)
MDRQEEGRRRVLHQRGPLRGGQGGDRTPGASGEELRRQRADPRRHRGHGAPRRTRPGVLGDEPRRPGVLRRDDPRGPVDPRPREVRCVAELRRAGGEKRWRRVVALQATGSTGGLCRRLLRRPHLASAWWRRSQNAAREPCDGVMQDMLPGPGVAEALGRRAGRRRRVLGGHGTRPSPRGRLLDVLCGESVIFVGLHAEHPWRLLREPSQRRRLRECDHGNAAPPEIGGRRRQRRADCTVIAGNHRHGTARLDSGGKQPALPRRGFGQVPGLRV